MNALFPLPVRNRTDVASLFGIHSAIRARLDWWDFTVSYARLRMACMRPEMAAKYVARARKARDDCLETVRDLAPYAVDVSEASCQPLLAIPFPKGALVHWRKGI